MKKEFTVHLIAKKGTHTLQRIINLFSKKQCIIIDLSFKETEIDTRIIITACADERLESHMVKKLESLYEIKEVINPESLNISEKNAC